MELWNYGLLGLSASLLAGWITQVSLDNPWSRGLSPKWENPTDELPFSWMACKSSFSAMQEPIPDFQGWTKDKFTKISEKQLLQSYIQIPDSLSNE